MVRKARSLNKHRPNMNDNPFPSSPYMPPTINIWFKYGDDYGRLQIHCLRQRWAAKRYIEVALNGREYEESTDPGWYISDDELLMFKLEGDVDGLLDMDDVEWDVPQPDLNQLLLAAGLDVIKTPAEVVAEEKTRRTTTRRPAGAPPVSRDGLVTLAEICEELKIEPRDARKTLRGKVEKPDAGWAWDPAEAKKIKAILK